MEKGQAEEYKKDSNQLSLVVDNYVRCFQVLLGIYGDEENHLCKATKHQGYHPFIPSNSRLALRYLRIAKEYLYTKARADHGQLPKLRFLDCGCGIGNVMLLASAIGFQDIEGIEFDLETWKMAKRVVPHFRVIRGDIVNFNEYGRYDIIYFYDPIGDTTKRGLFLKKLIRNMKVGAIIIAFNGMETPARGFKQIKQDCIMEKIK